MPLSPQQKEETVSAFMEKWRTMEFECAKEESTYRLIADYWIQILDSETSKAYSQGKEDKVREIRSQILEVREDTRNDGMIQFISTYDQILALFSLQLPDNKPESL